MRLDLIMVRTYGYTMLGIVLVSAAATGMVITAFADVPRIKYLIPLLGLWSGVLIASWLAMAMYYVIRNRFSRPV